MSIKLEQALGAHVDMLRFHIQRAEVLAGNIANADTPGYQARDLDFNAYVTDAQARLEGVGAPALSRELNYRIPEQSSADGNTVEIGQEQARFSQNAMDYQTSYSFLNMQLRGLKQAIEGQSS
ncbi:flagellar basal body rod protein FlgB [Dongshaea marina]|uniref:flagellar basal body rod protein FlgB n=1 Tax=Dongshaea marina TaxID=2047966 RepID=UPI000D3E4189|nr:flagellar basal body rod protein FlgB [Dongshaea marina]